MEVLLTSIKQDACFQYILDQTCWKLIIPHKSKWLEPNVRAPYTLDGPYYMLPSSQTLSIHQTWSFLFRSREGRHDTSQSRQPLVASNRYQDWQRLGYPEYWFTNSKKMKHKCLRSNKRLTADEGGEVVEESGDEEWEFEHFMAHLEGYGSVWIHRNWSRGAADRFLAVVGQELSPMFDANLACVAKDKRMN